MLDISTPTSPDPREYRLTWEFDAIACTPAEAAEKARRSQLDPRSWANIFVVEDRPTGRTYRIDLTSDLDQLVDEALAVASRDGIDIRAAAALVTPTDRQVSVGQVSVDDVVQATGARQDGERN